VAQRWWPAINRLVRMKKLPGSSWRLQGPFLLSSWPGQRATVQICIYLYTYIKSIYVVLGYSITFPYPKTKGPPRLALKKKKKYKPKWHTMYNPVCNMAGMLDYHWVSLVSMHVPFSLTERLWGSTISRDRKLRKEMEASRGQVACSTLVRVRIQLSPHLSGS
jgi:hypothetical protein